MQSSGETTPPCGVPLTLRLTVPFLHHPGAQQDAQELEDPAVDDPFLDRLHQPLVRDRLEAVGDVRLDHPAPAPGALIEDELQGIVRRALRPEAERARLEVGLEDRFDHRLQGRLHDPVAHRRDRKRPPLLPTGLRDEDPARRQRTVAPLLQLRGQLVEQTIDPVLLDGGEGDAVDAGRAAIGAHLPPRPLQDVPAVDLVVERVEASSGLGLGRPVERSLQFSDPVLLGGHSHVGTRQPFPARDAQTKQRPFPSPPVLLSGRLERYYGRLRRPPGSPPTSRLCTGYRARRSDALSAAAGPGRASPVPAATL